MRVTLVVFLGLTGHAQAYKLLELIKVYGRLSEHEFSFGRGGDDFADMPWPEPYSVGICVEMKTQKGVALVESGGGGGNLISKSSPDSGVLHPLFKTANWLHLFSGPGRGSLSRSDVLTRKDFGARLPNLSFRWPLDPDGELSGVLEGSLEAAGGLVGSDKERKKLNRFIQRSEIEEDAIEAVFDAFSEGNSILHRDEVARKLRKAAASRNRGCVDLVGLLHLLPEASLPERG